MEMIQTKRVALYIRVSTQEQALEGHSIQAQEQNGRQFAERMGYEVVEVYADEGISGKSTKKSVRLSTNDEGCSEPSF